MSDVLSKYIEKLNYYDSLFGFNYNYEQLNNFAKDASNLFTNFDDKKSEFSSNDEWHYISSKQNSFLIKQLDDRLLLSGNNSICDCGIGLGTALFDLYLQSKEILDKNFTFTGIEKHRSYIDHFRNNLETYWDGNINYIEDDIMNQDYSNYNIVYTFSPFRTESLLMEFYTKIVSEIKKGSLLIENREHGKGFNNILLKVENLEMIMLENIVVFIKI